MIATRRLDIACLSLAMVLSFALRAWGFGSVGIDHFDEGIYALAGLGLGSGWPMVDPSLIAYAPPGYPILVGVAYRLLGPSDVAAIGVSIVLGSITIPFLAGLTAKAFGRGAGLLMAIFGAFWGAQIVFSRMALTDALFLFAWSLAMWAGARTLDHPTFGRALVAGLAIGLAMNVKYNGWLVGLVLLLAALPLLRRGPWPARLAVVFALIVAGLVYIPWFFFVEGHGGYSSLLKHQSSYVLGPAAWWRDFHLQLSQVEALSGLPLWTTEVRPLLALIALGCSVLNWRPLPVRVRLLCAALAATALLLAPSLIWWVALMTLQTRLFDQRPHVRVVAWAWLVLAILTPLYHPYARLWLPVHAVGLALVCGSLMARVPVLEGRSIVWPSLVALAALGFTLESTPGRPLPGLLGPTDSLRTACLDAVETLGEQNTPVPVLARPSALYYLGQRLSVARHAEAKDLVHSFGRSRWLLIDTAQWRQDDAHDEVGAELQRRWEVAETWRAPLNPATWLDADPGAATNTSRTNQAELTLYRRRDTEVARPNTMTHDP